MKAKKVPRIPCIEFRNRANWAASCECKCEACLQVIDALKRHAADCLWCQEWLEDDHPDSLTISPILYPGA